MQINDKVTETSYFQLNTSTIFLKDIESEQGALPLLSSEVH